MTQADLVLQIDAYIDALFAPPEPVLEAALARSRAAGLPDIQISPGQGKLLYLLAKMAGAQRILEIGTLGGYSTIWLGRALSEGGRLTTLEMEPRHADVAVANIKAAGLADRVEVRVGPALETLSTMIEADAQPFDLVFLDADKGNNPAYLALAMRRVRSGSLILADNVIRWGTVLDPDPNDANAVGARDFNALIAADARLEAIVLQQVGARGQDGLAIARVK